MTANAFASVSLDPPLVLVCVDQTGADTPHLHAKKRFGVNVLAESQNAISQYYADPNPTHRHAEREAGARFDAPSTELRSCTMPWLILSAGCTLRKMLETIRSLLQKLKMLWCGREIRCCISAGSIGKIGVKD